MSCFLSFRCISAVAEALTPRAHSLCRTNTQQQITAHVYDVMRSQLPTLELDAVFEAKEDLAMAVKNALQQTMSEYGYQILQALITDIDPDNRVKQAMNEINSAKRLKFAVAEKAEGQKM